MLRQGREVWLYHEQPSSINQRVSLGVWEVPVSNAVLRISQTEDSSKVHSTSVVIRSEFLESTLWLRNWRPGDTIKQSKRPRKKISDLLAELKLDPIQRQQTLVLADEQGPLLMLDGPVDERALPKAADDSQLLIQWERVSGSEVRKPS
jgi:tRNA(Ile)-lysidine synthetase-like protein